MRKIAVDLLAAGGLACLAAGLYQQYGRGPALIVVGALVLVAALVAAMRGGRT